ncbi:hypothetical protein EDD15DRAFT_2198828 [Pisolithus albus]|nr:hypothetical protein EDD15DRAFT_2198828 [Pisolithus albus]
MLGRYAPLPRQQPSRDLSSKTGSDCAGVASYDFEKDFDYVRPPPGSLPRSSSGAVPNDFENTNGVLLSSPVEPRILQLSFFRRAVGVVLPTGYTRPPTSAGGSHPAVRGGGMENDGVSSNVTVHPLSPTLQHKQTQCHPIGKAPYMPTKPLTSRFLPAVSLGRIRELCTSGASQYNTKAMDQPALEATMRAHVAELGRAVELGTRLVSFTQDEQSVRAKASLR